MSVLLLILATLLMIVIPALTAAGSFFIALPWWIGRILRTDPSVHERLRLDVSEAYVGWTVASDRPSSQRLPYAPLAYAVLTALTLIAIEGAVFAINSNVPRLWYVAGAIASSTVIVLAVVVVWLFRSALRRLVDRELQQRANDQFSCAAEAIFETWWIGRQIDRAYAAIGLQAQSDVIEQSRRALLTRAQLGRDAALAEVIGIKNKADYDLRNLDNLTHLLTSALTVLDQVKSEPQTEELHETIEQIEQRIRSRSLADALEGARWAEAQALLEGIGSDLRRVLDFGKHAAMPDSVQDAYRVLNVGNETPTENIRAVVNAYRRVWHPDLARDELERQLCKPKMQQINVAWELIQKARTH